jgi:hypothetical protein
MTLFSAYPHPVSERRPVSIPGNTWDAHQPLSKVERCGATHLDPEGSGDRATLVSPFEIKAHHLTAERSLLNSGITLKIQIYTTKRHGDISALYQPFVLCF